MALTFSVPDTQLTLTLHNRRKQIVDNIFTGTAFLSALRRFGMIEMVNGGLEIVRGLVFSKNTTAGSFDSYDILDTTPQENETSARFPWAQNYVTISVSWTEERKNQGEGRLKSIVEQKSDDAAMSIRDKLDFQLMAAEPAAGSKDPISLQELIADDPTSSGYNRIGSIGNIAQDSHVFWRNQQLDGGAFSVADMHQVYNDCSDGIDPPTMMLTSQTVYQYYENSLVGQTRYVDSRMGDQGFTALAFKERPVIWSANIGNSDSMYFLNNKYFKLCIMTGADFAPTEFQKPDNQAARVAQLLWMGNLVTTNRRRLGVLHGITAPS